MDSRRPATAALGRLVVAPEAGTTRAQDMRPCTGAPAAASSNEAYNRPSTSVSHKVPSQRPASAAAVRQAAMQVQERAMQQLQAAGSNTTSDQLLALLRKNMSSPLAAALHAPAPVLPLQTEYRKHFSRSNLSTPSPGGRPMTAQTSASASSAWQGHAAAAAHKPAVRPHACTPYKPGSILVPAPSPSAAAAAGGRPLTAAHQLVPGAAGFMQPSPAARPSTALRPSTANPITHALLAHAASGARLSTPLHGPSGHGSAMSGSMGAVSATGKGASQQQQQQQLWNGASRPGSAMPRPMRPPPSPALAGCVAHTTGSGSSQGPSASMQAASEATAGGRSRSPAHAAAEAACTEADAAMAHGAGSRGHAAASSSTSNSVNEARPEASRTSQMDALRQDRQGLHTDPVTVPPAAGPSTVALPHPVPLQRAVSPFIRASGVADGVDVVAQMDRLLNCVDAANRPPSPVALVAFPASSIPQPAAAQVLASPSVTQAPTRAWPWQQQPSELREVDAPGGSFPQAASSLNLDSHAPTAGALSHSPPPPPLNSHISPAAAAPGIPSGRSTHDAASRVSPPVGALSAPPPATALLLNPHTRRDRGTTPAPGTPAGLPAPNTRPISTASSTWSTTVQLQPSASARAAVLAAAEAAAQQQLDVLRAGQGHDQGLASRPVTAAEEAWWQAKAAARAAAPDDDVASIDIVNGVPEADGAGGEGAAGLLSAGAAARLDTAEGFLHDLKATLAANDAARGGGGSAAVSAAALSSVRTPQQVSRMTGALPQGVPVHQGPGAAVGSRMSKDGPRGWGLTRAHTPAAAHQPAAAAAAAATLAASTGSTKASPAVGAMGGVMHEPSFVRQAAPMVLNLESLVDSTPEVLEFELEHMGLDELVQLNRLVDSLAHKGR